MPFLCLLEKKEIRISGYLNGIQPGALQLTIQRIPALSVLCIMLITSSNAPSAKLMPLMDNMCYDN